MSKFILWAPRGLTLIIIIFLVVMAFGIYGNGDGSEEHGSSLLMNLAPALILLAGMITGWKHKLIGGSIIILLGAAMSLLLRKYGDLIVFLPLATPVLVTGILYVISYMYERQSQRNQSA